MKVLLVGGGGREDALAWALGRSPEVKTLRAAPGNAGIGRRAARVPIPADDVDALVAHAVEERYDLVVVGPEAALVLGISYRLGARGVPVFGPSAAAARLEGSKIFAKEFLARHRIPTASWRAFDEPGEATRWLLSEEPSYPLVVKADGLAAGKGVVIVDDPESAVAAAQSMLSGAGFGEAGRRIVVEERLLGRETSFFVLSDGHRFVPLETCRDYKRLGDGDAGPNTGGMGTYSPSTHLDVETRKVVLDRIVAPTLEGIASEGAPYRGVLYVGLMLTETGPKVLEFNVRFGDPETQVLLPRLDGRWLPWLAGCAEGRLPDGEVPFRDGAAVCVVMASGGYPGAHARGIPIEGLERAERIPDVLVFHAGTETDAEGRIVTSGGRVLGVTAVGDGIEEARRRAYEAVGEIRFDGARHRTDIAGD